MNRNGNEAHVNVVSSARVHFCTHITEVGGGKGCKFDLISGQSQQACKSYPPSPKNQSSQFLDSTRVWCIEFSEKSAR